MPRVSFYTLGCKLNYAESSTLAREFEARFFDVVPFGTASDVTVINTCSVTDEADRKCRQIIRRAIRANPAAFVVVTGCYAQLQPDEIASIPGVGAVLGTREKLRLFDLVGEFTRQEQTQIAVSCIDEVIEFGPAFSSGNRTRAFLKVQDGCDYTCSFCTIPMARGRSRSSSVTDAVARARELAAMGFREVVLTGVNIGLFGEGNASLIDLLRALDRVDGIERYRISSIEPNLLTNEIVDFVGASARFQPHFHIPLQSGDDYVLGKMRRRYRTGAYASRVETILRTLPHAGLGVDVIVGFPAETAERFDNTRRFLADLPVSYLHVFTYSERAGTAAANGLASADHAAVPASERSSRNRQLRALSERKRAAFNRAHLGQVRDVLWEEREKDGMMYGYTDNYIRVRSAADSEREGRIEPVRLDALAEGGCVSAADPIFIPLQA
jgi:threonylcarbamoyladenosine tRNA methylthiotransferase MtaB